MESTEEISIDVGNDSDETLERLRNISQMFSGKVNGNDEAKPFEIFSSSDKIKRTFQKFEEIVANNGQYESDNDEDDENSLGESNGVHRSTRKKRQPKEHVPYHEMAEVKDKFEKGLVDANKPRVEKRLDIRVQTGSTSSKKQAFEHGTYEQENENQTSKVTIDADLVLGLTSAKKQAFEQQQIESTLARKTSLVQHDLLAGAAKEKKAKFENSLVNDRSHTSTQSDEIATIVGAGLAQAKRSELLSKIDAEQQMQRSNIRPIDIDAEQGFATARRDQLATLATTEFKSQEKHIDVTAGLASTIKEQYMADTSRIINVNTSKPIDIESGLAKTLANVFENPDETTVKRTVEITSDLLERGVAKERVAMFKNLESGSQSLVNLQSGDSKIRVDENGNVVRETDKREEIYFEKGQTKQLVEQWKSKQVSPERDLSDGQIVRDSELLEQGRAKNLVQMWKTIDKENSPPTPRRAIRAMTPPADGERRLSSTNDDELLAHSSICTEEKITIESGYAKAIRQQLLQNAEHSAKKLSRQITPPPLSSEDVRRKFSAPNEEIRQQMESLILNEEFVPAKGQAKSLKNRFVELEQDALKVETAASKIKYVPKRFVDKPVAKPKFQASNPKEKIENEKNQIYLASVSP